MNTNGVPRVYEFLNGRLKEKNLSLAVSKLNKLDIAPLLLFSFGINFEEPFEFKTMQGISVMISVYHCQWLILLIRLFCRFMIALEMESLLRHEGEVGAY